MTFSDVLNLIIERIKENQEMKVKKKHIEKISALFLATC